MMTTRLSRALWLALSLAGAPLWVSAQTNYLTVDPASPALTNYTGLGEWNTDGDFEGWSVGQIPDATVTNGVLTGTSGGASPLISKLNFPSGPDLDLGFNDYLELRLQLPSDYNGDVRIFYGDTFYPGISAPKVLTIPSARIPKDGAFHVYRFDVGPEVYWRAFLRDLQLSVFDATGVGKTFALDYLRVGDLAGDVYLTRYSTANPAPGQLHELGRPVIDMTSKHFRFLWDTNVAANSFWTANMPRGTLRNLEEAWQVYVKHLGYREPAESWTPAKRDGNKYKVNMSTWHSGYWAGGDLGGTDFGRLNITPDGLQVDPPTWVIPHELMHVFQFHQHDGGQTVIGSWSEGHANYARELWIYYYRNLYPNDSNIDANYIHSGHMHIAHGRDYYLSWPFFVYLDENPDGLPDLGNGIVANMWKSNAPNVYPYITLEQLTPVSSIKDIIGYFARRELTFDYQNQAAITNALNTQNPTVWRRFQLAELVRRPDDTNWWRVPMEMAPMQGAYATHELIPDGSGAGRVVTVNLHGLPDAARAADWRAAFIIINDSGAERYGALWSGGSNSITLAADENRLFVTIAGTPDSIVTTDFDDLLQPYRSHPSKQRLHYELQVFGATPKQSNNGSTAGLIQHPNGGGWKSASAGVDSTAFIGPNARVLDSAQLRGAARVEDYAVVRNNAQVRDAAVVSGHALVWQNSIVKQNSKVRDWAIVSGTSVVADNARVLEHAQIQGGLVTNNATAKGCAILWDAGLVGGYGVIEGDFMAARVVTNGFAFGHLPYTGVPDSWVRVAPDRFFAGYEFNDANESMVRDSIGATDGYLVGNPTWLASSGDRVGVRKFNGIDQYVVLDRSLSDFREMSVAAWIRWDGGAPNQIAWHFGSATNKAMFFVPDNGSGSAKFIIRNGGAEQAVTIPALPAAVWTHVTVTLSNAVAGRIYTNGVLLQSAVITLTPQQLNATNIAVGTPCNYLARGADASQPFFNGALDSVRIYSKPLTAAEIVPLTLPIPPNAGALYVDLRASDPSAGALNWTNRGTLGNFTRFGSPSRFTNVAGTGIPGVLFGGSSQAYTGPNTVPDLDGGSDRSIEVWAYNQTLADEETTVSWGHRGSTRQDMAFNFGANANFGAVTHWGDDLGWGTPPAGNAWHYLVYTYSNSVARVYVDGALRTTKALGGALNTFAGEPINLACQRDTANGTRSLYYSGYLNSIRIHGGTLSDEQVAANYLRGPAMMNTAPVLTAVSNLVAGAGATVAFTNSATDSDVPAQTLTFSLVTAPGGATVQSNSGLFTWRVPVALADTTNLVQVKVADDGLPSLSATQNFFVTVNPLAIPSVAQAWMTNGQFAFHVSGDYGPDYTVQTSTNLANWWTIFTTNSPALPFDWMDTNAAADPLRFYRILLGP